jgi:hypothetical protein
MRGAALGRVQGARMVADRLLDAGHGEARDDLDVLDRGGSLAGNALARIHQIASPIARQISAPKQCVERYAISLRWSSDLMDARRNYQTW